MKASIQHYRKMLRYKDALERILKQLKGIEPLDLTTAERAILVIASHALEGEIQ